MSELTQKIQEAIESPLKFYLPQSEHRLPLSKEEIDESLTILQSLKKENSDNSEVMEFIAKEEQWLNEGYEMLIDENTMPDLLISYFTEIATLKIQGRYYPHNVDELDDWNTILAGLEKLNPSDKELIEIINDYKEFLGYYDAAKANQMALEEIANNIYTKEDENGAMSAANKEEAIRAYLISIKPNDFPSLEGEVMEQLREQIDVSLSVLNKFGVSSEELDYAEDAYLNEPRETLSEVSQNQESNLAKNYSGSANEKAYEYIDKFYNNLSYVDKEGYRWAASAKEVEDGYVMLAKAESEIVDGTDNEIKELVATNHAHLNEANVRKFAGAWWLIICAGIVGIFQLWSAFGTFDHKLTPETAVTHKQNKINSLNKSITYLQQKPEITKDMQKRIDNYTEEIAELKDMKAEKYARKYNRAKTQRGILNIFWALVSLGWIVGYYFAARPYGYDRFKRQYQYQRLQKATGGAAKVLSGILGVFWSIPITTYITKYTDGSEERSSDAMGILAIQLFVTVFIVGMVLLIAKIVIPFATIIAYIRNYPGKAGAKQVHSLFKNGKGFAQSQIDKILNKQVA